MIRKYVLVPGAWLGSWAWNRVASLLIEKGHEVYPLTLTGMGERVHLASKDLGIETAIQDVVNVIKYNDLNDFVLVGHSFAGKVVAAVADRVPEKVKQILYLDAFRPSKGDRTPQGSFHEDWVIENGGIVLTKEILDNIGKDVKGDNFKWLEAKATPWPQGYAEDPVTLSKNFDLIKDAYIFCTGGGDPVDQIIAGKWGKLDGPYKVMETGHWPMITKPEELVEDLIALTS